ncbi:MAG TPA: biotin synthase BioB [Nitrososphaeraceae archaeon]|nr:biotin synthase BioB [Nitrososphaeraceae archaeon]
MLDHLDDEDQFIKEAATRVLSGDDISIEEAQRLLNSNHIDSLIRCSNTITRRFNGDLVDVETLVNAKSGACPEDCSFCAQSSHYKTGINKYDLLPEETILKQAQKAKESGANSFCLVCAYRSPPKEDFEQICKTITEIKKKVKIDVNVSLGFVTREMARRLKSVGVKRYNHNLETAESYFSQICKTHDFYDRVKTAKIVVDEGLELCCGGIIGMGESPAQRLELAFSIKSLHPNEVPINILIARKGTPLEGLNALDPMDAIKTIAVWRFIMPRTILKIAGGREIHLKDKERIALKAGANGIITGGYLTTGGNRSTTDIAMIKEIGLSKAI